MSTLLYYSVKIMALTHALEDVIKQTARADEIHMHVYTGIQQLACHMHRGGGAARKKDE